MTNPNFTTWVESVEETRANIVISMVTRAGGFEAGSTEAFWVAVLLDAPLGNRAVVDANGHTPIGRLP